MTEDSATILEKTARGAGWVVAWRMVTRTLGLVSTLVLVRLLAPADFGLVALGSSFATSIEAFSWIGVEEGVIRHKTPTPELYNTAFTFSVLRGLGIGLIIAGAAYPGAAFFGEPRLAPVVLALALAVLLESLTNIGVVEFRRDFGFRKEFQLWLLPRLISIAVTITLAALFHTYWALIAGILTSHALRMLFSYAMHPYRPRLGLSAWRDLAGYSAWTSVVAGIGVLRSRVDTMLIGRVLDATQVGYYAIGYEIAELPVTELIAPLSRAAFSGFAAARRAELAAGETWVRLVAAMSLLTFPAGVGMSAVAYPLIELAFGAGWEAAVPVVQVLGLAFCLAVFGMVGQTVFLAHANMRTWALITIVSVAIRAALLTVLIPLYGISGAAVAAALGMAIEQVVSAGFAMRGLHVSALRDLAPQVWRCLLASLAMAAGLWWAGLGWRPVGIATLPAEIGLGAAVYLGVLALLWLASGRPAGPETDVLGLARGLLRRGRA